MIPTSPVVRTMRVVTDTLDAVALLLVAFAAGAAVFPLLGWPSAGVSGVVIWGGVRLSEFLARRSP